jgi:Taurine catabolism dioxygenase TauD, TfdA family
MYFSTHLAPILPTYVLRWWLTCAKPSFGRDPPYSHRALLHHHEGNIILSFARPPLTGHHSSPRSPGIPNLTEGQAEALDAVHFIAQSHQLLTTIEPGDIRFFNNLGLLHCREPFEDKEGQRRHIVRLWLRDETGEWPLPPSLRLSWARVFHNDGRQERWEIEPPAVDWKIIRHRQSHGD